MSSRRKFRLCCLYLPLYPSLSLLSPPPHSLSPAIPSLPLAFREAFALLQAFLVGLWPTPAFPLREASAFSHCLVASLPLASREASPLTGLWQPSGIDQERSLVVTCVIRVDKYM